MRMRGPRDWNQSVLQRPQLSIALKCLAVPRTSTVEKRKPVAIKFFREDFSFIYDLFSTIYFK